MVMGVIVHKLKMTFIFTMCLITQATERLKWIWDICIYLRRADVDKHWVIKQNLKKGEHPWMEPANTSCCDWKALFSIKSQTEKRISVKIRFTHQLGANTAD